MTISLNLISQVLRCKHGIMLASHLPRIWASQNFLFLFHISQLHFNFKDLWLTIFKIQVIMFYNDKQERWDQHTCRPQQYNLSWLAARAVPGTGSQCINVNVEIFAWWLFSRFLRYDLLRENFPRRKIQSIRLYEGNRWNIVKITTKWKVLPTFSRK